MDERIKKIAEHYGMEIQREQLIEELSELILAAQKCKRYGTRETFDNFCGELADVYIMVCQMMHLISPEIIGEIIESKLDRQIQRIHDESEPETAELPEVDIEGMQSGEIRTARNGDAWIKVKKI
jgi:NTP pyrophosphatase (non-canonical NTP hydrolase)